MWFNLEGIYEDRLFDYEIMLFKEENLSCRNSNNK